MDVLHHSIGQSLSILRKGGIILYPTDTIWGIGCDATNAIAVQSVYQLKKRDEKKSMILLVSDESMIKDYVSNASVRMLSFLSKQKKPTTAVFKKAIHLPETIISNDGTIAIRITKDQFCKSLIQQLKKPLISTSANISGEKFPQNFNEVSEEIKNGVDYIVKYRQDDLLKNIPSSIIKLNENGGIEFIRR